MEPANASGPGPAATVLVPPKKLNGEVQVAAGATGGQLLPLPTMFLAPLKYPPVDVTVLPLPKKLVAKSE